MLSRRNCTAVAIASVAAVGLVSAACGGGTSSGSAVATACQTAYKTWANGPHGRAAFNQISADVGIVTSDMREVASSNPAPSAVTRTFNEGGKLGVDSSHALENPPPSCVPGFGQPYHAALSDSRQSAVDILSAMTALRAGNKSAASSSVAAFASDLGAAQTNIKVAEAALTRQNLRWG
jgi:hypothetical protein